MFYRLHGELMFIDSQFININPHTASKTKHTKNHTSVMHSNPVAKFYNLLLVTEYLAIIFNWKTGEKEQVTIYQTKVWVNKRCRDMLQPC